MAFENLSERLQNTIAKLTGKGKVSEADVKEMMREVRLALLEADVNFKVVKDFVKKISERAVGTEVMKSLTPAQQIVKIVNEELVELLGGTNVELNQGGKITTTMMVGLQGAGKTTTAGKLALKVKKTMKKKPLLIAADVYRPAAVQQLKTLGKQLDIEVFYVDKDPVDIVKEGLEFAREHYYNYVQEVNEKQHILIHDIKNHLNTISQLNDGKHIDEITRYINNILGSDALRKSKRYCKIDILNVIISRYAEQCNNSGISFEADIRANTLEYLPAQDFTSIFCNLLDNAIDASLSCDEPYIDCNVSLIRGGNADLISIANSCKSSPLDHDGKLHSRKQGTGFHGYGLKSVKRIADKYNGLLNYVYSEEKHEFRVVVMLEHP